MKLNVGLAERILGGVNGDSRFFVCNGEMFSSLLELKDGLKKMGDEDFFCHVNGEKNDFANWVRNSLGDVSLADSLVGISREEALKKVTARISYVERYLRGKK